MNTTEFEVIKVLHSFFIKGLMTKEQVEKMLFDSKQLKLTYIDNQTFKAESLDGKAKYKSGS